MFLCNLLVTSTISQKKTLKFYLFAGRVPTMWADTHVEPPLLSGSRKFFASDPHLKQSAQISHKTIQPNLSNELDVTSMKSAPISPDDLQASIAEASCSPDTFAVGVSGKDFKMTESGGGGSLQSTSIKFQKSAAVDTNFSEI